MAEVIKLSDHRPPSLRKYVDGEWIDLVDFDAMTPEEYMDYWDSVREDKAEQVIDNLPLDVREHLFKEANEMRAMDRNTQLRLHTLADTLGTIGKTYANSVVDVAVHQELKMVFALVGALAYAGETIIRDQLTITTPCGGVYDPASDEKQED